jgi:hypothetical protein
MSNDTCYYVLFINIVKNLLSFRCDDTSELRAIQISTVDAFQGGERGVIILSCVRTCATGFMDNDKFVLKNNLMLCVKKNLIALSCVHT